MNQSQRSNLALARATAATTAMFPLLVTIINIIQRREYDAKSQAVSELALGQGGWLMTVAFCSLGTGTLLLTLLLRRMVPGAKVGPALLFVGAPLSVVSAFVHADPSTATTATTHGQIHILAGLVTFVLMITAMFVLVRALRRNEQWRPFGAATLGWSIAAVGAFLLIPTVGETYFGLAQRIFLGTLLSWTLTVAWCAGRIARRASTAAVRDADFARPAALASHTGP